MTRGDAIEQLKPFIPSLNRAYRRWGELQNKAEDRSWLYRDESFRRPGATYDNPNKEEYLPEVIPEHFLEDTVVELKGHKYKVVRENPLWTYRRVYLQVLDFGYYGNTHKYGQLKIAGLYWYDDERFVKVYACELNDIEPRVQSIWDVDLLRIVAEGEMGGVRKCLMVISLSQR